MFKLAAGLLGLCSAFLHRENVNVQGKDKKGEIEKKATFR